jgi:hypothetical protein
MQGILIFVGILVGAPLLTMLVMMFFVLDGHQRLCSIVLLGLRPIARAAAEERRQTASNWKNRSLTLVRPWAR